MGDRGLGHPFHVERSRMRVSTRCGLDARRVPTIPVEVARDPFFWRPGTTLLRLSPGVDPIVCVECARSRV